MKSAVILFPGTNGDTEICQALERASGFSPHVVWHKATELPKVDIVVLGGGFAFGDYLRSGAIAARSPIMEAVRSHVKGGAYVLGICNGFQILTECRLLEGVLLPNRKGKFIGKTTYISIENTNTVLTRKYKGREVIAIPVAHKEGCYFLQEEKLRRLEEESQILFRYCNAQGQRNENSNINGSVHNIAGIMNKDKTVFGLMPHPERFIDCYGATDGYKMILSLVESM